MPSFLAPSVYVVLKVKITPKFGLQKSILVCYELKSQLHCMKERFLHLQELQLRKLKSPACNKTLTRAHRTPCVTQREM